MTDRDRPVAYARVLWAISARYKTPNLVAAFSDGLTDALPEEYEDRVAAAMEWFLDFSLESDGPWTFWTTVEQLAQPEAPTCAHQAQTLAADKATWTCEECGAKSRGRSLEAAVEVPDAG